MKKIIYTLIIILIINSGCTRSSNDLKDVTLMLDYTPNTNHSGIYVGIAKGYYEDYGIDLTILDNSSNSTLQSVANQTVDFGISYEEDLTIAYDNGITNLKSIYTILKENTSGFISFANKNITEPSDFKGKTYCGWGSDVETSLVTTVANDAGVSNDEFDIATVQTDFLRSNPDDCDFFWEFEGWAVQEAILQGIDYNYIPLKDLGYDLYSPIIITSDEFINTNFDIVQNFINATILGYEYAYKHPEEAAQIFLDFNPSYDEELIQNSQLFLSPYYIASNGQAGYQQDDVWKNFSLFLETSGIIHNNEYKELYTNEFIDQHYKS